MRRAIVSSVVASARFERARAWLAGLRADQPALIAGGSLEGASELARAALGDRPAAFGWKRLPFVTLAATLAEPELIRLGLAPATPLALEAVWARAVHGLASRGELGRFAPVGDRPGLPRALARTVNELRLSETPLDRIDPDLRRAAEAFDHALTEAGLADRAALFRLAAAAPIDPPAMVVLLDVPMRYRAEQRLVEALARTGADLLATTPEGDERTLHRLTEALPGITPERLPASGAGSLARLQRGLFAAVDEAAPAREDPPTVDVLSAPGEGREAVEIARRLHAEAARGVPFERMGILLRAPSQYRSAVAEALARADIPAYFARGTRGPDPSGRALLALLACADERLSARRFAEYLSLGEVPSPTAAGAPPPAPAPELSFRLADAEELAPADVESEEPPTETPPEPEPERAPVIAPRKWEQLIIDAAVIGGHDRWKRRLDRLSAQLQHQAAAPDLDEARAERLQRDREQLETLSRFALPLIEDLAHLPAKAPWGEWLLHLRALSDRALRYPDRVQRLLSELQPMAGVGPVALGEVRLVLAARLSEMTHPQKDRRPGRVFVGSIDDARGLDLDVVFVPGLAERIFPQRLTEDPILLDAARAAVSPELETSRERAAAERLQLRLAAGAAGRRIHFSYPRVDAEQARPRVPSFYGLEVLRASEGTLPDFTALQRKAERASPARIGWPAPEDPSLAIDAAERDLSVLDAFFQSEIPPPAGSARYLLEVNESLARALRRHGRRRLKRWTPADGLVKPGPEAMAALQPHALSQRSFSPTALQHFAACPYRFFLKEMHRLFPRKEPEPIEQLDPLQRGGLVHEVQYRMLSELRDQGHLPLSAADLPRALSRLDAVLAEVAEEHREVLAPSIERIWKDGLDAIKADVREWLRQMQRASADWTPWKFELAFGLRGRDAADPDSRPEPVELEAGLKLRGSIDLVERSARGTLRATDYKTGRPRAVQGTVVGGGETLQPVLYALTLERMFPDAKVEGGRLYYCTQAGGFSEVTIPLDGRSRELAREVSRVIGGAITEGFFPAAPTRGACDYCDFLPVCGPGEEQRWKRKPKPEVKDLLALRDLE
ncbi:MAG TPA: PD-(D/E)XK nuclease family protein [Myxococcaceae bacterium]